MISYKEILDVFWSTHNHCATPNSRQYMSAVFYANDEQKKIALELGFKHQDKVKQRVTTFVLLLKTFYLAEGYHQKYALRQRTDLFREMAQIYPKLPDFLKSTAATRMNGYLGSYGTYAQLEKEVDGFGLTPRGRATLLNLVKLYGKK